MSKKAPSPSNDSGSESDGEKLSGKLLENASYISSEMRRRVLKEMISVMPVNVQNRVTALKNLQLEQLNLESEFFKEVYNLEKKYLELYQPLYDKRKQIVNGEIEPPKDEKPNWKSDNEDDEPEDSDVNEKLKEITSKVQKCIKSKYPEDVKGVPDFWLTIFRNVEILSDMVQEHDEPALKKLRDIKIIYNETTTEDQEYTLEFHFDKNDYFSNAVLTKQYFLKTDVDKEHPWEFEGPEVYKCIGCTINWEKGNNLTIKTIRKKQKHKERGAFRFITKQVPNDSFFNFFNPPEINEDKDKLDEESQTILATDFEIGHLLRSSIIPKAALYYTGDIVVCDDDEFDEEEEEGEEEDDDDYDADDDENHTPQQKQKNKKPLPNECPNQ